MLRKIYKIKIITVMITAVALFGACSDYLDLIPDDLPTIDIAFSERDEAVGYLATCYSYFPKDGSLKSDAAIMGGDEYWSLEYSLSNAGWSEAFRIAQGLQNSEIPLCSGAWSSLYNGLRDCNIFLENIDKVPDILELELRRWKSEVTFLKAYYHFYLLRMYGPIPLIKTNLPIGAPPEEVRVSRNTAEECFDYIVELLDKVLDSQALPFILDDPTNEMGRITHPIAAAFKAKVLVFAASPLFSGNEEMAPLENNDGTKLFNQNKDEAYLKAKWAKAMEACKEAIDLCHETNVKLYKFKPVTFADIQLPDTILYQMSVRLAFTERWNSEIIWANTQTPKSDNEYLQRVSAPVYEAALYPDYYNWFTYVSPTLKIAEMFYTKHGVPIDEDLEWKNRDLYALRTGTSAEKYQIRPNYTTIELHYDREPRFYAGLGFDGGQWYGQGAAREGSDVANYLYMACRVGGAQQKRGPEIGTFTGYFPKKIIHYRNAQTGMNGLDASRHSVTWYPWPIMRLADLYLLYAEAINEAEGPNGAHSSEMFAYIDSVRLRAGVPGVKEAWDNFVGVAKYNGYSGMRDIIHRERLIELSQEGQRFWDLRRWREAPDEYRKNITGFKLNESAPEKFYQPVIIAQQSFTVKDYFWPITTSVRENNMNLVQNLGW
ncbi:MAG: RagB/SusD family nutrient uptake outer membrane protein [Prevotellaceae bacterium]|jgi:hypothetical protein|nr:RagB/SusD family nutrient uptake outer membrane protein [Prevotellaceae bacterium]